MYLIYIWLHRVVWDLGPKVHARQPCLHPTYPWVAADIACGCNLFCCMLLDGWLSLMAAAAAVADTLGPSGCIVWKVPGAGGAACESDPHDCAGCTESGVPVAACLCMCSTGHPAVALVTSCWADHLPDQVRVLAR